MNFQRLAAYRVRISQKSLERPRARRIQQLIGDLLSFFSGGMASRVLKHVRTPISCENSRSLTNEPTRSKPIARGKFQGLGTRLDWDKSR